MTRDDGVIKLVIQRCKSLRNVLAGIEYLTNLKVLKFFNMPDELIMKLHPVGGEDYSKVAHVSAVYSSYWIGGGRDLYSLERFIERDGFPESPRPSSVLMTSHNRSTL